MIIGMGLMIWMLLWAYNGTLGDGYYSPVEVVGNSLDRIEEVKVTCQYCNHRPARSELSIDHVVPRSRGGSTTWNNVVLACTECNARKRDHFPYEAGMQLQRPPREPAWRPGSGFRLAVRRRSWARFVDTAYWDLKLHEDHT